MAAGRMKRVLSSFLERNDGVVAVIFAVMAIPFIALAGWAVDYMRLQHVKDYLQARADEAALNIHEEEDRRTRDQQWGLVHAATMTEIGLQYQGSWARNVTVSHDWIGTPDEKKVRVDVSADVPLAFMHILPGIPSTQRIDVAAISQANVTTPIYKIEVADLDYDAGDYNRVWAYCYWPNRPDNNPDLPKRTQMVPIADNGGPANKRNQYINVRNERGAISDPLLEEEYYNALASNGYGLNGAEEGVWRVVSGAGTDSRVYHYIAPQCPEGEAYLSLRLENVRFARTQHQYWEDGDPRYPEAPANNRGDKHTGRFNYYTDTYEQDGVPGQQYDGLVLPDVGNPNVPPGQPANVLETVLCRTWDECDSDNPNNIIPSGHNRTPERAAENCQPGEYMYYGFEDRPPGLSGEKRTWEDIAWTDADYDDIRVIIQCPEEAQEGERNARLVG